MLQHMKRQHTSVLEEFSDGDLGPVSAMQRNWWQLKAMKEKLQLMCADVNFHTDENNPFTDTESKDENLPFLRETCEPLSCKGKSRKLGNRPRQS